MGQSSVPIKTIEECAVELIDFAGHDLMPATAARVSFNADMGSSDIAKDIKLMGYLADHEHMSCFEHQTATLMIECPLFIRSQIQRHRTFSYNEISRRYTEDEIGFWIPDKFRKQSSNNKQGSAGVLNANNFVEYTGWQKDGAGVPQPCGRITEQNGHTQFLYTLYEARLRYMELLENGVCREQARAVLPQALLTRFYMTGNLRNWAHFLELRLDGHAQHEVQVIAQRIYSLLSEVWPHSLRVLGLGTSTEV